MAARDRTRKKPEGQDEQSGHSGQKNGLVRPGSRDAEMEARKQAQAVFLEVFATCGNVTDAATAAGIGRSTHYDWLKNDEDYAKRYEDAERGAGDVLIREGWRRAIDGVETPVFGSLGPGLGTGIVGHVMKKSDALLERLMKAYAKERFAERHEVAGPRGGAIPVKHVVTNLAHYMTDEELAQRIEIEERALARARGTTAVTEETADAD